VARLTITDPASLAALVAANLAPLAGVVWFGWNAGAVVQLYWMENLVIGVYAVLKYALSEQAPAIGKAFAIPFFCMHYGGFCAVHGFFIQVLFNTGGGREAFIRKAMDTGSWPFDMLTGKLLATVVRHVWESAPAGTALAVVFLVASHGVSFVRNYLMGGEKAMSPGRQLMTAPYNRVVVLHMAILAGGMGAMLLGDAIPILVALIALKIGIDIWSHSRSHRIQPQAVQEVSHV